LKCQQVGLLNYYFAVRYSLFKGSYNYKIRNPNMHILLPFQGVGGL
jgi:hypothetical protein